MRAGVLGVRAEEVAGELVWLGNDIEVVDIGMPVDGPGDDPV